MGLLLILVPWSAFWDRNYFAGAIPFLKDAMASNYVRGAVSGLGLVNIYAAVVELSELFRSRGADGAAVDSHGP